MHISVFYERLATLLGWLLSVRQGPHDPSRRDTFRQAREGGQGGMPWPAASSGEGSEERAHRARPPHLCKPPTLKRSGQPSRGEAEAKRSVNGAKLKRDEGEGGRQ